MSSLFVLSLETLINKKNIEYQQYPLISRSFMIALLLFFDCRLTLIHNEIAAVTWTIFKPVEIIVAHSPRPHHLLLPTWG